MHVGIVTGTDVDYGLDLANSIAETGASVSLYLSQRHASRALNSSSASAERFHDMDILDHKVKLRTYKFPRMRDPRSLNAAWQLSSSMIVDKVDLAHILLGGGELWQALLSLILRRIRGVPVVSTMIVPRPNSGEHLPPTVQRWINKILLWGSDIIVVNGRNHVDLVKDSYGVSEDRIEFIPLGPRTTAAKWSSNVDRMHEDPGTILFFGRVVRYKGLEYLIKAQPQITNEIPHARIVIAGQGPDLERCRHLIRDSDRFEIIEGFIPNDLAAQLFQRSSLVALPYLSASSSGVLMTSYVFGKPAVASGADILPEYVQDGVTGLLVEPGNVGQLASAIVRLLSDDSLRHEMGRNAANWMRNELSPASIASRCLDVYKQTIGLHPNSSESLERSAIP